MERADLLMVAMEVFPELNARGFFTVVRGNEFYFSGLQKMEITSAYKPFYEEYDIAFSVKCQYSVCDRKTETRWIRMEGDHHVYETPMLYMVNRYDLDESPSLLAERMIIHYRANVLVVVKYNHPSYSLNYLKKHLSANGIYLVVKNMNQEKEVSVIKKSPSIIHNRVPLLQH